MTDILKGNTDPNQNNWWSQYKLAEGKTRRPATLKTGTSDQTEDLFALGYVAPPDDPNAPAIVAGVLGRQQRPDAGPERHVARAGRADLARLHAGRHGRAPRSRTSSSRAA